MTDSERRLRALEQWVSKASLCMRQNAPLEENLPPVFVVHRDAESQHEPAPDAEPQYPRTMSPERESLDRAILGDSSQVIGKDLALGLLTELDAEREWHLKTKKKLDAMTRLAKEHRAAAIFATDRDPQCVGFGDRVWREAVAERDEARRETGELRKKHERLKVAAAAVVAANELEPAHDRNRVYTLAAHLKEK